MGMRLVAIVWVMLATGLAHAEGPPTEAKELFEAARTAYNLGNFEEAVEKFKRGYELSEEPAFLYNVAQSYRQMRECREALFFYKRFLAMSRHRGRVLQREREIDERITEM